MKFKETELLKFDTEDQKYEERTSVVEFSLCMINDELYQTIQQGVYTSSDTHVL